MAKRKIITINEDLCNGCGNCVTGCAEGALQIINGKAKLVKEDFCDGFGDCIGHCPTGAMKIEEREAAAFDEMATVNHLRANFGEDAVEKYHEAQKVHAEKEKPRGCPGLMNFSIKKKDDQKEKSIASTTQSGFSKDFQAIPSELGQWPVQLHLINPAAPFLSGKELVVVSTCSPTASADVHWRYIRGRNIAIACPKLDRTEPYVQKLADIFKTHEIPRIIILRMEVPCCGGLTHIVQEAKKLSGKVDLIVEEHTVSIQGSVISIKEI